MAGVRKPGKHKTITVMGSTIRLHPKTGGGAYAWKGTPDKKAPQSHPWRAIWRGRIVPTSTERRSNMGSV